VCAVFKYTDKPLTFQGNIEIGSHKTGGR